MGAQCFLPNKIVDQVVDSPSPLRPAAEINDEPAAHGNQAMIEFLSQEDPGDLMVDTFADKMLSPDGVIVEDPLIADAYLEEDGLLVDCNWLAALEKKQSWPA